MLTSEGQSRKRAERLPRTPQEQAMSGVTRSLAFLATRVIATTLPVCGAYQHLSAEASSVYFPPDARHLSASRRHVWSTHAVGSSTRLVHPRSWSTHAVGPPTRQLEALILPAAFLGHPLGRPGTRGAIAFLPPTALSGHASYVNYLPRTRTRSVVITPTATIIWTYFCI